LSLNPLSISRLSVYSRSLDSILCVPLSKRQSGRQAGKSTAQNAEAQDTCVREEHGKTQQRGTITLAETLNGQAPSLGYKALIRIRFCNKTCYPLTI
jgi:hypothetical protein